MYNEELKPTTEIQEGASGSRTGGSEIKFKQGRGIRNDR